MKLLRHGPHRHERPALMDADGILRDLSGVIADITPETLSPAGLARLAALDPAGLPALPSISRVGPPWCGMGKFIGVGLNYVDHTAETRMTLPSEPVLFLKATSCVTGAHDPIVLPRDSRKSDWEVELGVVIGSRARYVSEADALSHVAGYCVVNDVSERAYQLERGGTWDKGKGCDTFGPVGPWLVTADEVPDPQSLSLWLDLNAERMQDGRTADMVFGVAALVSYISRFMTLEPGDLITTGTPAGVGLGRNRFLQPGDHLHLGISGLGEQRSKVHEWDARLLPE